MRKLFIVLMSSILIFAVPYLSFAQEKSLLVHIKTDLAKDDAQICVAYNVIWAALEKGYNVNVLIDASAVNTYKNNWRKRNKLAEYKMPESLRRELSRQFNVSLGTVPKTYGEYLNLLNKKGAKFYINGAMLVVAGISKTYGDMSNIAAGFFIPMTISEMAELTTRADKYIAY